MTTKAVRVAERKKEEVKVKVEPEDKLEEDVTVKKEPQDEEPLVNVKVEPEDKVTEKPSLLKGLLGDVFITGVQPAKSKREQAQPEITRYRSEPPLCLDH